MSLSSIGGTWSSSIIRGNSTGNFVSSVSENKALISSSLLLVSVAGSVLATANVVVCADFSAIYLLRLSNKPWFLSSHE